MLLQRVKNRTDRVSELKPLLAGEGDEGISLVAKNCLLNSVPGQSNLRDLKACIGLFNQPVGQVRQNALEIARFAQVAIGGPIVVISDNKRLSDAVICPA